jgi:hypothetical protein
MNILGIKLMLSEIATEKLCRRCWRFRGNCRVTEHNIGVLEITAERLETMSEGDVSVLEVTPSN